MTDTRKHILDTAFALFLSKSYKAVTMSELEKATGLTKGAFYHYFKSKEEIFTEILNSVFLRQSADMSELDQCKTLREFIDVYLNILQQSIHSIEVVMGKNAGAKADPMLLPLMIEAKNYHANFDEKLLQLHQRKSNSWERIIVKAKEIGEIRSDVDASILAENFLAMGYGMMKSMFFNYSVNETFSLVKLQHEQLYRLLRI
jgi:AcrR family transcriptional regulator